MKTDCAYKLQERLETDCKLTFDRTVTIHLSLLQEDQGSERLPDEEDYVRQRKVYRVEINDAQIEGIGEKTADVERRLSYLYDWCEIAISHDGQPIILHKDELKDQGERLCRAIRGDYPAVDITTAWDYDDDRSLDCPLMQYSHFALLFPCIPSLHGDEWRRIRNVRLSPKIPFVLEEEILLLTNPCDERCYRISGTMQESNTIELKGINGSFTLLSMENRVKLADVQVELYDKVNSLALSWNFNLSLKNLS